MLAFTQPYLPRPEKEEASAKKKARSSVYVHIFISLEMLDFIRKKDT